MKSTILTVCGSAVMGLLVLSVSGCSDQRSLVSEDVQPRAAEVIADESEKTSPTTPASTTKTEEEQMSEKAILAGGCFWGMQDLIRKRPGVVSTRVGYTGGDVPNATYRNHGSHAEAIEIVFDPKVTNYRTLLEFFFQIHDPTTANRQGNDIGASYRSAIYYTTDEQKQVALDTIEDVNASGLWPGEVVTEVEPAGPFWEAEPEHQDYLERIPDGYTCHFPRRDWVLPKRAKPDSK
jgi:peptide-methionine (S)-S-oxide reductase